MRKTGKCNQRFATLGGTTLTVGAMWMSLVIVGARAQAHAQEKSSSAPPAPAQTKIGDRIKFSDESSKSLIAPGGLSDDQLKPKFDFLGKSSVGGVLDIPSGIVPSANVPNGLKGLNARQAQKAIEKYDEKKNWAYKDPKTVEKGPTVEEILETPTVEQEFRRTPKRASDKYIERISRENAGTGEDSKGQGQGQGQGQSNKPDGVDKSFHSKDGDGKDDLDGKDRYRTGNDKTGDGVRNELQVSSWLEPGKALPFSPANATADFGPSLSAGEPLGPSFGPGGAGGAAASSFDPKVREQREQSMGEFRKLLDAKPGAAGVGTGAGAGAGGNSLGAAFGNSPDSRQGFGNSLSAAPEAPRTDLKMDKVQFSPMGNLPTARPVGLDTGFDPSKNFSVSGPGNFLSSPSSISAPAKPAQSSPFSTPFPQRKF